MNNHKLTKKNIFYVFVSLVLSLSVYLTANSVLSAPVNPPPLAVVNTLNSTTTDAIAVRIVANPAQYSIDEWYAKQGFTGSPQKIKVDGYDAVRDNRTVYVAATNIKGFCTQSLIEEEHDFNENLTSKLLHINTANALTIPHLTSIPCSNNSECGHGSSCSLSRLYFNIYIITYNQGAAAPTSDVFGKILSNWKFNNNLNDQLGDCSFPPKNCGSVSDCGAAADYNCTNSKCASKRKCLSDADCASDALCTSPKSKLLRDVKRLQSLNQINQSLKSYKNLHNKYPILAAGTFLPQVVISTWPSWQNVFVPQIGTTSFTDPINKIGLCNTDVSATTTMAGFDATTCWNGTTKKYYNESNSANLELPVSSYAMVYTTDANGSNYKLCANMETNFSFMSNNNVLTNLSAANCHTTAPAGYTGASNNPPVILAMNLNGVAGEEFNGYIKAEDPEGNAMTFSTIVGPEITGQWNTWNGGVKPVLKPTTDPKQKKLYSVKAGAIGNYSISIRITDSNGASVSTTSNIKISGGAPIINASDVEYDLSSDPNNSLDYNLYFDDANFDYLDLSYSTTLASAAQNWLKKISSLFITPVFAIALPGNANIIGGNLIDGAIVRPPILACSNVTPSGGAWRINKSLVNCFNLNNGLKGRVYSEADGRYRLNIYGTIDTAAYSQNTNLTYKIKVHNSLGKTTEKNFTIKLKSNPPQLDFSCNKKAGLYQDYSCQINNLNTKNKVTTYTYSYIDLSDNQQHTDLPNGLYGSSTSGLIIGMPTNLGNYKFKITAKNEYGASTQKEYELVVESSCGKTLVPHPGGPWNQRGDVKNQGGYYKTVLIGGQCWLGDNLNVPTDSSHNQYQLEDHGSAGVARDTEKPSWWNNILSLLFKPYAVSAQVINITQQQLYGVNSIGLCYNGDNAYCEAEGRLYKASEIMSGSSAESVRGICPAGYHIPSKAEYTTLNDYLGSANASNSLKQNGDSGFEGFLAGSAEKTGNVVAFADRNNFGTFWSSTVQNAKNFYRRLSSVENSLFTESPDPESSVTRHYSLRCIQDKPCPASCSTCNTTGVCCNSNSWSPAVSTKCGSFPQTNTCGSTRNAVGTINCIAPNTCGGGGVPNVCGTGVVDDSDHFVNNCTPSCAGKICGSDGCGGSCGTCYGGWACNAGGTACVCVPNCTGQACGDGNCQGYPMDTCGQCPQGSSCQQDGTCGCEPDCQNAGCSSPGDGCGGTCPGTQCGNGGVCYNNVCYD